VRPNNPQTHTSSKPASSHRLEFRRPDWLRGIGTQTTRTDTPGRCRRNDAGWAVGGHDSDKRA